MKHIAKCPVSLGLEAVFGTKCSCGSIHPSIVVGEQVEIDTTFRWVVGTYQFERIIVPIQSGTPLFKRGKWGMVLF